MHFETLLHIVASLKVVATVMKTLWLAILSKRLSHVRKAYVTIKAGSQRGAFLHDLIGMTMSNVSNFERIFLTFYKHPRDCRRRRQLHISSVNLDKDGSDVDTKRNS